MRDMIYVHLAQELHLASELDRNLYRDVLRCKGLSLILCSAALIACESVPPPPVQPPESMVDQRVHTPDMTLDPRPVDMEMMTPVDLEISGAASPPAPGWLEVQVNPGRTFYRLSDQPTLNITGYDVYGAFMEEGRYVYRFNPPLARLTDGNDQDVELGAPTEVTSVQLQFVEEGSSELEVCALNRASGEVAANTCVIRPFVIDERAPQIKVFWPPRGAMLAAQDPWPAWDESITDTPPPDELFGGTFEMIPSQLTDGVPIYGQVIEEGGTVSLSLNGTRIETDEIGRFSAVVPSRPGYLEFSLVADDGVRTTPSTNRRWSLYAQDYLSLNERGSTIDDGLVLGLNQRLVDDDLPLSDERPVEITEAAQLIALILTELDPERLLGGGQLINTSQLSLSLMEISLGDPEIDLQITADGLSLFVDLNRATVRVSGAISLGGDPIDLSGELDVAIGAFADYRLSILDQSIKVTYLDGAVALHELTPRLNNAAANAILELLESTARALVVDQLEAELLSTLRDELPELLGAAVDDLSRSLNRLGVELDTGFVGAPVLDLSFLIEPERLALVPGWVAQALASWTVERAQDPDQPEIMVRGVPALYPRRAQLIFEDGFSLQIHADAINAIFTEITRGGLLKISPEIPASAQFFYTQAQISPSSPPVLVLGEPSQGFPVYLELGGLALALTQAMSGVDDEYEMFIRVGAMIITDGGRFSVALADQPEVNVTLAELNNDQPAISEQLIENLIVQQLWPLLSQSLTEQLVLGFPDSSLQLDELRALGVDLGRGSLSVNLDPDVDYAGGWIHLGGQIEIDFDSP